MRVWRTFAFLDLTGFTALTESGGDQRAVAVLAVFRAALRDICSRRGVRIAKWLGDGAMLVCVEAPPLIAATLEMQAAIDAAPEDITIKCGITSGPVILLEGDDYIGHAVNLASRLCDRAGPHQVLVHSAALPHRPPWATVDGTDTITVPGLEQEVDVALLGLPQEQDGSSRDPICQIALDGATAAETRHDSDGRTLLFCSLSCAEAWEQNRVHMDQDSGSIREVWMR